MSDLTVTLEDKKERAIIVGVDLGTSDDFAESMEELEALAEACNMEVVCVVTQKMPAIHHSLYIGTGKVQEVKEYVREHRGVNINTVAEECDVEPGLIRQWLREERLELTEDSGIMLSCEACGALIRSGKYCEKCKSNLANGFNNILQGRKPVENRNITTYSKEAKMRFLSENNQ